MPSLLQAEKPQLLQPFLIGEMLQSSDLHHGSPLGLLQEVNVLSVLGSPELDAVFQMGSHESMAEAQNPSPSSSCWACCFGCSLGYNCLSGLWVHTAGSCPASHTPTPSPSQTQQCYSQSLHPAACIDKGAYPNTAAAPCTWPYGTSWGSHGSIPCPGPSIWYPVLQVWSTTQLGDVCRLAEGALKPIAHIASLPVWDPEYIWSHQTIGICHPHPLGHWIVDHYPLDVIIHQYLIHPRIWPANSSLSNLERWIM